MNNPGLSKQLKASAAVEKYRIVVLSSDGEMAQASAVSSLSVGVNDSLDVESGEFGDAIVSGIAPVTYGGAVAVGERLTSDADGRAVPVSAATDVVIGKAMVSGVVGDTGSVLII